MAELPVRNARPDEPQTAWLLSLASEDYTAGYFTGQTYECLQPLLREDWGGCNLAGHTLLDDPEHRNLRMVWMRQSRIGPTFPWHSNYTVLRECWFQRSTDGLLMLYQQPAEFLKSLRIPLICLDNVPFDTLPALLQGLDLSCADVEAELEWETCNEIGFRCFDSGEETLLVGVDPLSSIVFYDCRTLKNATGSPRFCGTFCPDSDHRISIRLLLDRSAAEIFFADGIVTFSITCYPEGVALTPYICGGSAHIRHLSVNQMNSIHIIN